MSIQRVTSFTPTAAGGQFKAAFAQNPLEITDKNGRQKIIWGYLVITNETAVSMQWMVNGNQITISPWQKEKITLSQLTDIITWSEEFVLSNSSSAPADTCIVDGYSSDEILSDAYPIPLVRSTSTVTTSFQAQELITTDSVDILYVTETAGVMSFVPNQTPADTGAAIDISMLAKTGTNAWNKVFQTIEASNEIQFFMKLLMLGGFLLGSAQKVSGNSAGTFSHTLGVTPQFVLLDPTQVAEAYAVGGFTSTTFTIQGITSTHQWIAWVVA